MEHLREAFERILIGIRNPHDSALIENPVRKQGDRSLSCIRFRNTNHEHAQSIRSNRRRDDHSGVRINPWKRGVPAGQNASVSAHDCPLVTTVLRAAAESPGFHLEKNEREEEGENFLHGGQ